MGWSPLSRTGTGVTVFRLRQPPEAFGASEASMIHRKYTWICQDLIHPMYSASLSIVLTCLLYTPLGPDHPWCASGNALTYHCACVSTWWNTVLCQDIPMMHWQCTPATRQLRVSSYIYDRRTKNVQTAPSTIPLSTLTFDHTCTKGLRKDILPFSQLLVPDIRS